MDMKLVSTSAGNSYSSPNNTRVLLSTSFTSDSLFSEQNNRKQRRGSIALWLQAARYLPRNWRSVAVERCLYSFCWNLGLSKFHSVNNYMLCAWRKGLCATQPPYGQFGPDNARQLQIKRRNNIVQYAFVCATRWCVPHVTIAIEHPAGTYATICETIFTAVLRKSASTKRSCT